MGRKLRVLLHAAELIVYDGQEVVARRERLVTKAGSRLELDHYLEVLVRNRGRCPTRPRWSRHARRAGSPRSTTSGERLPARPTETRTVPGP